MSVHCSQTPYVPANTVLWLQKFFFGMFLSSLCRVCRVVLRSGLAVVLHARLFPDLLVGVLRVVMRGGMLLRCVLP